MTRIEWKGEQAKKKMRAGVLAGLEAVGILVEGDSIERCPVDTGYLKNSLTHQVKPVESAVRIGTNSTYAEFPEFGTRRQKAQPYLRPALDENTNNIIQLFKEVVGRGMR